MKKHSYAIKTKSGVILPWSVRFYRRDTIYEFMKNWHATKESWRNICKKYGYSCIKISLVEIEK